MTTLAATLPRTAPQTRLLGASLSWWLLIAPAVILMLAFYAFPLAEVLWISFTEPEPGFGNYERLLTSPALQRVWMTTLRICVITTAITLVAGYVVAYALVSAPPRIQRWMFVCVLLPLWISVLVRAFAWVTLLRSQGVVNEALVAVGLIDRPLRLIWNEFGIAVGMVHYMIPYAVLPLYASMRDIDPRLVPAARGLGATRFEAFRRVFLPLTKPGIVAATVLVFIFSLGFYVTPAILGGGRTLMVAEYIKLQILDLIRWGVGTMMASTLLAAVVLVLAIFARIVDFRRLFGSRH
ncbi:ABC transporter permease [Elioraea sp. Yellowstone]|jgi:putative spermidine/putrescine transport system permease protein|uniref:ABC transporter permease n=1 Tax=Elioraea sp. Yellowstone TaxID=2592070 RepID=UPI001152DABB|nr:ABC transporter permease [Elioraea sp. Yellowstone]TQF83447.1 ABC transporter permease [Elioraea sp. Yellowstone]